MRKEYDSMGEVLVEDDKMWMAQTQRSLNNFNIGNEKMPIKIIYAICSLKRAAALANFSKGRLNLEEKDAIVSACDEILDGKYDIQFPLSLWQTGSGTQTNMNVNEVISFLAKKNYKVNLHPNDHVNKSQSTNDVFPSAIHLAAYKEIAEKLLPILDELIESFKEKEDKYKDVVKLGRTHLQDATPLSVGAEISAWKYSLEMVKEEIVLSRDYLLNLAIGGTAVGSGINSFEGYDEELVRNLNEFTGYNFRPSKNKYFSLSSKNEVQFVHNSLKLLATELLKIGNDIRWLASGPRSGIGEYIIPSNEPGSSIMPGKVNPTQVEALSMVAARIFGNDTMIDFSASQGNFQLNVYMPLIAYTILNSIELLSDVMDSFRKNLVEGIKINKDRINYNLENSLMTVTALNPIIGYENSAKLAKYAHENGLSLFEANRELKLIGEEELKKAMDYKKMAGI